MSAIKFEAARLHFLSDVFVAVAVVVDDDDGSERVDKKMNLRSFKRKRVYVDPLNMSNAGDISWSWILKNFIQVQKEEGKFVVVCSNVSTSSTKRQIRRFHVVVVQWTSGNVLKSAMHVQSCCFDH